MLLVTGYHMHILYIGDPTYHIIDCPTHLFCIDPGYLIPLIDPTSKLTMLMFISLHQKILTAYTISTTFHQMRWAAWNAYFSLADQGLIMKYMRQHCWQTPIFAEQINCKLSPAFNSPLNRTGMFPDSDCIQNCFHILLNKQLTGFHGNCSSW